MPCDAGQEEATSVHGYGKRRRRCKCKCAWAGKPRANIVSPARVRRLKIRWGEDEAETSLGVDEENPVGTSLRECLRSGFGDGDGGCAGGWTQG